MQKQEHIGRTRRRASAHLGAAPARSAKGQVCVIASNHERIVATSAINHDHTRATFAQRSQRH
jgi:hypothetical protein